MGGPEENIVEKWNKIKAKEQSWNLLKKKKDIDGFKKCFSKKQ